MPGCGSCGGSKRRPHCRLTVWDPVVKDGSWTGTGSGTRRTGWVWDQYLELMSRAGWESGLGASQPQGQQRAAKTQVSCLQLFLHVCPEGQRWPQEAVARDLSVPAQDQAWPEGFFSVSGRTLTWEHGCHSNLLRGQRPGLLPGEPFLLHHPKSLLSPETPIQAALDPMLNK